MTDRTNTLAPAQDNRGGADRPLTCGTQGFRCGGCQACKLDAEHRTRRTETRPAYRYVVTFTYVQLNEYGTMRRDNEIHTRLVYGPSLAACKRAFDHRTNSESSMRVLFVESAASADNARRVPVDPCSFADTNYRNRNR